MPIHQHRVEFFLVFFSKNETPWTPCQNTHTHFKGSGLLHHSLKSTTLWFFKILVKLRVFNADTPTSRWNFFGLFSAKSKLRELRAKSHIPISRVQALYITHWKQPPFDFFSILVKLRVFNADTPTSRWNFFGLFIQISNSVNSVPKHTYPFQGFRPYI